MFLRGPPKREHQRRQDGRHRHGIRTSGFHCFFLLGSSQQTNEAYLRLIEIKQVQWQNRVHFFAMASRIMRRILVDAARAKAYQKRGGGAQRVSIDEALGVEEPGQDFVALDDALNALEAVDGRGCRIVEMRFFGGLSVEETAEALDVSARR